MKKQWWGLALPVRVCIACSPHDYSLAEHSLGIVRGVFVRLVSPASRPRGCLPLYRRRLKQNESCGSSWCTIGSFKLAYLNSDVPCATREVSRIISRRIRLGDLRPQREVQASCTQPSSKSSTLPWLKNTKPRCMHMDVADRYEATSHLLAHLILQPLKGHNIWTVYRNWNLFAPLECAWHTLQN
jgi:hypothetical protein